MSQANKSMTDKEIEMMEKRYSDALKQERLSELEAENQKLRDANRYLARVNRMIPISEKKPTRKDFFLCQIDGDYGGSVFRSRWFEGNKFDTDDVVVAWCELPEPYQGDV